MYTKLQEDKQETHSGGWDGMGIGACRKREANVVIAQPFVPFEYSILRMDYLF